MVTQQTDAESQDAQTANISLPSSGVAGFRGFTDASGFTITDVTAKWGAIGSANPRYTGDIGMSMVPYAADVAGEEMGYMAMSNLDGVSDLGSATNLGVSIPNIGGDGLLDGVGDGFTLAGAGLGAGALVAGLGLAGSALMFASVSSVQAIKIRKATEIGLKKATDLIPSKS